MAGWIKPCPVCGTELDLLVLIAHDGARDALRIALDLPVPLNRLAVQYVFLFRPQKRGLSADRFAELMGDVLQMVEAKRVTRGGIDYPAPPEVVAEAIRQMLGRRDTLRLPLSGHGYLSEVISAMAQVGERATSTAIVPVGDHSPAQAPKPLNSKTAQGLAALERMKKKG